MSDSTRVYGVLVTFSRSAALAATLDRLEAQTRHVDRLLVIDNEGSSETRAVVEGHPNLPIAYVDAGDNLGPAGGFALGMRMLLEDADDSDWIFLFDDDDPPFFDTAIESAVTFGKRMVGADPDTGGVGISGGRFDVGRGRVLRIGDADIDGPVPVDHITGGGLPAYRVGAVRQVGVLFSDLFFGFEELEYGLRMTGAGFRLYADGNVWKERKRVKRDQGLLPPEEVSEQRASATRVRVGEPSWRRYYSLRNLIYVLRESGASGTAFKIAVTRGLAKPFVNLFVSPGPAWRSLKLSARAVSDGWRGRLGRTVAPGPIPDSLEGTDH
jgi:glycosyltransferase involved in cell wall biosynthesis